MSLDVRQLGAILGVWAHPDDETVTSAGIMAAAVNNGQTVVCITATRGEAGIRDPTRWPPEQLGDIRSQELAAALEVLGVRHHRWLEFADGQCSAQPAEASVTFIMQCIEQHHIDTILTFGPEGLTGHPDHQTVSSWATQAACQSARRPRLYYVVQSNELYKLYLKDMDERCNIFFNIDQPPLREEASCDLCFELSPELNRQKLAALAAMPSQTAAMLTGMSQQAQDEAFACECFEEAT